MFFCTTSSLSCFNMEFPPAGWEIFPATEFETAAPRVAGDHVMELMAQIRPNGRCVDNWRIAIGGGKILEADIRLKAICKSSAINPYKLRFQAWPRDIKIRRNMTTSRWLDGIQLIERREFAVFKDGTEEATKVEELLAALESIDDAAKKAFAIRFGVGVGPDRKLVLELQGLPASEASLKSKPGLIG